MLNTKKPRRALPLNTETLRQLSTVELTEIAGGVPPRTLPCSIPCTTICSSGL
jgi:hypothetical protein